MAESSLSQGKGKGKVNIPIRYLESAMNIDCPFPADESLDPVNILKICHYGSEKFAEMLGIDWDHFKEGENPFQCKVLDVLDTDRRPKKAEAFTGQFQLFLKQEYHESSFPSVVRKLQEERQNGEGASRGLKEEVAELTKCVENLVEEDVGRKKYFESLQSENTSLKTQVAELTKSVAELKKSDEFARNARLRIAIEEGRRTLIRDLKRSPGEGASWTEFMNTLTPSERADLLKKISRRALDLMSKGKYVLDRGVHTSAIASIARAVTSASDKREAWIELFKYGYQKDPESIVFDVEEEV